MDKTFKRHIVQFLHPGTEYRQRNQEGVMDWNTGMHHRKFLCAKGDYVDGNKCVKNENLLFWGEWEPQSKYERINRSSRPSYLHYPYLDLAVKENSDEGMGRNTDPFVFADAFYYRCCQQIRKTGPTELFRLEKGSIVLFGSKVGNAFALDTVFVVCDSRRYKNAGDLKGFAPDIYSKIVRVDHEGYSPLGFRCYKGSTFENQIDGMYSFVPCRIKDGILNGFERPLLTHNDIEFINEKQMQGFKLKREVSLSESKFVWENVRKICREQNFLEGLKFQYATSQNTCT